MPWIDRSPLEYQVNTASSFRRWEDNRPPVSGANGDYKQFKVGDHWLDTTAQIWWILCYRDSTMGIWKSVISASGVLDFLTGDAGGAIGPDIGNNINILGGAGITTTGNPVTNTISIALTSGALTIDHVIPNIGGTVSPDVLGNVNLIGSGGVIVTGTPGTNTLTIAPSGGGSITQTFTANIGAPVPPTVGGNLNILGGVGITTTGTPGTNTISIALTGGSQAIDTITGNVGGAVSPDITGNLNVIGTATNGISVTGNPGANTQVVAFQTPYSDGDFEFQTIIAGATRNLSSTNTDNTNAASNAKIQIATGGVNSGDPFVNLLITGTKTYSVGIDNSDADTFKITDGITPSVGNILFQITTAGVPSFPTAPLIVSSGGTGVNSITANALIIGDGTNPVNEIGPLLNGELIIGSTGAAPVAATLTAGAGIAIANAAGSITISSSGGGALDVYIQTFTVSGNYVPTAGMTYCIIEVLGGGGGGGGAATTGGSLYSAGSGGGGGEYARGVFSAATIGASQSVTIGIGGAGNSGLAGSNGGNTSVGALISANGGTGGSTTGAVISRTQPGVLGGTGGSGGSFRTPGYPSSIYSALYNAGVLTPSNGGNSIYGAGGLGLSNLTGGAASGYGAGGGGSANPALQFAKAGGQGSAGIVIITEYI